MCVCLRAFAPLHEWSSCTLTALCWAATGRDSPMYSSSSIPCFPTLSFPMTVISAHWSRSKCFSRSRAQRACVLVWVCVQEEGRKEHRYILCSLSLRGFHQHTWPLLSVSSLYVMGARVYLCLCSCPCVLRSKCANVQASVILLLCVSVPTCAQACQICCASSMELSSSRDHEGYFWL